MTETTGAAGTLYVIAAPSGAGKTSLVKALVESTSGIEVSVSHTTRAPRPGEQDGVHYHFIDVSTFREMVDAGAFLEHAQVFDNFYGTAEASIHQRLATGADVILEIDWQGARQVRERIPGAVGVFILPPSREALAERLTGRGQDDAAVIARRMRDAVREMSHYDEFDYLVINDVFDAALAELRSIFVAGRLRREVQHVRQRALLRDLLAPEAASG